METARLGSSTVLASAEDNKPVKAIAIEICMLKEQLRVVKECRIPKRWY